MQYESMQYEQSGTIGGRALWSVRRIMTGALCGMVLGGFATNVHAQPASTSSSASNMAQPAVTTPAQICQLEWHNRISLQDGVLNLAMGGKTFQVKSTGQLYFGIHKVKLNDAQMGALADYHALMRDDLPYMLSRSQLIDQEVCQRVAARQVKEHEIQSLIPALKRWQTVTITE